MFAHLTEAATLVAMPTESLPKFRVSNDPARRSKLKLMSKVAHPLSERFADEERSPDYDIEKWILTVELTSDKRHVLCVPKLPSTPNDMSSDDGSIGVSRPREYAKFARCRQLRDVAKSALQLLAATSADVSVDQPRDNHRGTTSQSDRSVGTESYAGTSDAGEKNAAVRRHPAAPDDGLRAERRKIKKSDPREQIWKQLDNALYTKTKTVQRKCRDRKPSAVQPIKEETKPTLCPTDPRSKPTDLGQRKELDLPLPAFRLKVVLASKPDGQRYFLTVKSFDMAESQKPIEVVIGIDGESEAGASPEDGHGRARASLMESVKRSIHLLDVLSDDEFSREMAKLQNMISTALEKHHSADAD